MIIVMKPEATEKEIEQVIDRLISKGFDVHRSTGVERTIIGVVGQGSRIKDRKEYESLPGVARTIRIT